MIDVEAQKNFGLNLMRREGNPQEGETTDEFHIEDSPMWQYRGRPWSLNNDSTDIEERTIVAKALDGQRYPSPA